MADQVYTFKLRIKRFTKLWRTMEVKGETSLHDFAKHILHAFDFACDHAFGFHDNLKSPYDSVEKYTSFADSDMQSPTENELSVKNHAVHQVFTPNKTMLFHFDYGDDWEFLVQCLHVKNAKAGQSYPVTTKKHGIPPKQYPDVSDDDTDNEYDDC